jgi:hypothetical protein
MLSALENRVHDENTMSAASAIAKAIFFLTVLLLSV